MKISIPEVFEKTQHIYYWFHVTGTWKQELEKLFMTHKGLKIELESLINYPLGPSGFESVWKELVEKYVLHDHPTINSLWEKWKMWVMSYFKGLYCRRMTSTQRSESTTRVLKDGFVNSVVRAQLEC
jgi:hypothetical protein